MNHVLYSAQQARQVLDDIWTRIKGDLLQGKRFQLSLKAETRSLEQNRLFHGLCDALGKSGHEWGGRARTADEWKVLLVSAHGVATKQPGEVLAGLEGELVQLRESTAHMDRARASSLLEYSIAYCAKAGVPVPYLEPVE